MITPIMIKNCFVKCGFLINHVSKNDNGTVKLTEDEKDGWHSLHSPGVQSQTTYTCDRSVESRVSTTRRSRRGTEVAEHKSNILECIKRTAARKHVCQSDTENNITVTCNKVETELYRLRAQGEKKQRLAG